VFASVLSACLGVYCLANMCISCCANTCSRNRFSRVSEFQLLILKDLRSGAVRNFLRICKGSNLFLLCFISSFILLLKKTVRGLVRRL
jgi:hypothetical protein